VKERRTGRENEQKERDGGSKQHRQMKEKDRNRSTEKKLKDCIYL
jgi:hypothetical protein